MTTLTRHRLLVISMLLAAAALLTTTAFAQVKQYTENKSDLALRSEAHIDPATLGMSLEIPLGGAPGRGVSVPNVLRYSSKQWRMKYTAWWPGFVNDHIWTKPKFSENAWSGWTTSLEPPRLEYTGKYQKYEIDGATYSDNPDAEHSGIWRVYRIHLHLPDGSSHELRKSDAPTSDPIPDFTTGTFYSVDGTGMRFEANTGVLYMADGGRYFFGGEGTFTRYNNEAHNGAWATQYIDRNGNSISYSLTSVVDTLGRGHANPLTTNPTVGEQLYYVAGVGGANLTYKLRWSNLGDVLSSGTLSYTSGTKCLGPNSYQTVSPNLFASLYPTYVCADTNVFNPVVLSEVELPNGQKYQFKYNIYGEIDRITYPTGGYERFRYAAVPTVSDISAPYDQANRGVVERWVSPSGTGAEESTHHWVYSGGVTSSTAPDGTRTELWVHASAVEVGFGFNNPLEGKAYEERTYNASGQMVRRTLREWQVSGAQSGGYPQASRDPRVIKEVSILLDTGGNALATTTTYQHDADFNVISSSKYHFASIAQSTAQSGAISAILTGSLARTDETTYLVNDTSIASTTRAAYRARNLLGLPTSTRVKDSTGVIVAQSEIRYDEAAYPLLTYGTVTGWADPLTSVRGLPTTSRSWLNTTGAWLESHAQYDQCGSPRKNWDAKGHRSEVEYSSAYHYAYPTLTRTPVPDPTGLSGSASALLSTNVYDFTSGKVTSSVDANNVTTTFEYNATWNRLSRTVRASGTAAQTQTSVSYDDVSRIVTTTSDLTTFNDNLMKSQVLFDGLGRTAETRGYETATTYITTKQTYDAMGRVSQVSNPYRAGQTVVWTTSTYDALGRALTVTTPDNAVVTTVYSGNTVTVTDQAGKDRQSTTDALGRLTQVIEDPGTGGLGYVTSYLYDTLNNPKTVTQGSQTRTFNYDSLSRLSSAVNPESGTITYTYDNNGNLTGKTDARSITTTITYDALNRPTLKDYSDSTPDVRYFYDTQSVLPAGAPTFVRGSATGKLVAVTWGGTSAGSYYGYNELGQILRRIQQTDSINYLTDATYNKAGGMLTETYPNVPGFTGRRTVSYSFDTAGRLSSLSSAATTYAPYGASLSSIQYAAHGALATETLGNSLKHELVYNNRLQPVQIKLGTTAAPTSVLNLTYNYGTIANNGNVLDVTNNVGTWTTKQIYVYDSLNRLDLTTETNGSTTTFWTEDNAYDRHGNRWEVVGGLPSLSFNTSNNRITTSGYAYDASGNVTNDTTPYVYTFDAENRIKTVSGVANTYQYDGEGKRVKKYFPQGEQLRFIYGIGGQLIMEFDTANGALKKEYIYGSGGLLATIEPVNGTRYTTADHLGTPRVVTSSTGTVVSRHDYKAFGRELLAGVGGRTSTLGFGGNDGLRQKFTQKERDNETGLDYFINRYYSSTQGRFTSVDPIKLTPARMLDPQQLNLYPYVRNNPLKFIDPDGKEIYLDNDTKDGRRKALLSITANMKAGEARNVGIRWNKGAGKYEAYIIDPSKINLNKASQGYKDFVDRVGNHDLKLNYTFLEKGKSTTVEIGGVKTKVTNSALSGARGSDAGGFVEQQSDGSFAVVVAEGGYMPGVAGLTKSGKDTTIAFPDHIVTAHELFAETYKYTPAGIKEGLQNNVIDDSNKVIEIENKYRDFHGLPHRSGKDHGYIHGPTIEVR